MESLTLTSETSTSDWVIDRVNADAIFTIIGASRVRVQVRANHLILTPAAANEESAEAESEEEEYVSGPDSRYIDPADYATETDYVNAIPGLAEELIASMNAPASEFTPIPRELYRVGE